MSTSSHFHHVFHFNGEFYATPYSQTDHDFMADTVSVCSEFPATISNDRLARLLSEILHFSNALLYSGECEKWDNYRRYCLRRLYSLEVRLQKATGQYACNSILMTLYALPLVHITL